MVEKFYYNTVKKHQEFQIEKIKGSKFIGNIFPVQNHSEYKSALEIVKTKYHDATHSICHAVSYGTNLNFSLFGGLEIIGKYIKADDNGEPANTAGKPILTVIQGESLHNVLVTVTRYFGGTLLGIGGLIQAYSKCAKQLIENSKIIKKEITTDLEIIFDYEKTSDIMNLLSKYNVKILEQICEEKTKIKVQINLAFEKEINSELKNIIF